MPMTSDQPRAATARRLKCLAGPADGLRYALAPGATEVALPAPPSAAGTERVAVYRVARRRRGRGAAFDVLVFAGTRPVGEAPAGGGRPASHA